MENTPSRFKEHSKKRDRVDGETASSHKRKRPAELELEMKYA
jgi:hypothetical protein